MRCLIEIDSNNDFADFCWQKAAGSDVGGSLLQTVRRLKWQKLDCFAKNAIKLQHKPEILRNSLGNVFAARVVRIVLLRKLPSLRPTLLLSRGSILSSELLMGKPARALLSSLSHLRLWSESEYFEGEPAERNGSRIFPRVPQFILSSTNAGAYASMEAGVSDHLWTPRELMVWN